MHSYSHSSQEALPQRRQKPASLLSEPRETQSPDDDIFQQLVLIDMPSWLVDDPTLVYLVLGLLALALGVIWWINRGEDFGQEKTWLAAEIESTAPDAESMLRHGPDGNRLSSRHYLAI